MHVSCHWVLKELPISPAMVTIAVEAVMLRRRRVGEEVGAMPPGGRTHQQHTHKHNTAHVKQGGRGGSRPASRLTCRRGRAGPDS